MSRKKMMMILFISLGMSGLFAKNFESQGIKNAPVLLREDQQKALLQSIRSREKLYDPEHKMIIVGSGYWEKVLHKGEKIYHATDPSIKYALDLLDSQEKQYEQRAFDVISKTISLQAKDPKERFCGVWPYYEEEPLVRGAVYIDYNWANFISERLMDIYIDHYDRLPQSLRDEIKESLILATNSIIKRNVQLSYTNVAISSIYCVNVAGKLFDIKEYNEYAHKILNEFYDYTKKKGGFSEYNSPSYTVSSLDNLEQMQSRIMDSEDLAKVKELYHMNWAMIARHHHKPTAQWAGPYSRVYFTLVRDSYHKLIQDASDGKINYNCSTVQSIRLNHHIPADLLGYFTAPVYPRTEVDLFEPSEPQVIGTAYLTDKYAFSSSNRSSLWGQRRPLMAFWGEQKNKSNYFQLRFLHDDYDFSAASLFTQQMENKSVSALNFATNGGDRHILLDTIAKNRFKAKELRLVFEFGNCKDLSVTFPKNPNQAFNVVVDGMNIGIQLPTFVFGNLVGYWERCASRKEKNMNIETIAFVFYRGEERTFDWNEVGKAAASIVMAFDPNKAPVLKNVKSVINQGNLDVSWGKLKVSAPVAPQKLNRRPANQVIFPGNL
ncbi:MAG: hypothetical protein WCK78_09795 [Paludibacter sp.]